MIKNKELKVVKKVIFLKRVSFWIFFLVIVNLFIFFAFTQNYYYQNYFMEVVKNVKLNKTNFSKNKEINNKVLEYVENASIGKVFDECLTLENFYKIKIPETPKKIEITKLNSLFKVKNYYQLLNNYYEKLEDTNSKSLNTTIFLSELNEFKVNSTDLVNICINYYSLSLNKEYLQTDELYINRIIKQINNLKIDKIKAYPYLIKSVDLIKKFKQKNYTFNSFKDAKSPNEIKLTFNKDVENIINSLLDFKNFKENIKNNLILEEVDSLDLEAELYKLNQNDLSQNIFESFLKISI
jgi:hypothetical protein